MTYWANRSEVQSQADLGSNLIFTTYQLNFLSLKEPVVPAAQGLLQGQGTPGTEPSPCGQLLHSSCHGCDRGRALGLSWRLQAPNHWARLGKGVARSRRKRRAPKCDLWGFGSRSLGVSTSSLSPCDAEVWTVLLWCGHQQEHGLSRDWTWQSCFRLELKLCLNSLFKEKSKPCITSSVGSWDQSK